MTELFQKEAVFYRYFITLSDSEKRQIAKNFTKTQTLGISQIILNAIQGTFKIRKDDLPELKRFRLDLYEIADRKSALQRKRVLIAKRVK
jgi:hypothetical protein